MSDDFTPNKWPVLPATQTTQRRQGGLSLPSSHVPLPLFMLHRDQAWGLRSISLVVPKGEKGEKGKWKGFLGLRGLLHLPSCRPQGIRDQCLPPDLDTLPGKTHFQTHSHGSWHFFSWYLFLSTGENRVVLLEPAQEIRNNEE